MSASNSTKDKTPIYLKHSYLTCRSPTNSFYLCRTLEDVYDDMTRIRIQWYAFVDETRDENNIDEETLFKLSHNDTIDIHSVLTNIKSVVTHSHKGITMKKSDINRTQRLLKESIKAELPRTTRDKRDAAPVRKRRRTTDINEIADHEAVSSSPSKRTGATKAKLFKVQSNRFLKENQSIIEYEVDPFFATNTSVPFISSLVQGKLAMRAVRLNDEGLLKNLIDDVDHVHSVHIRQNLSNSPSAIHYAIQNNNNQLFEILADDMLNPKNNRTGNDEATFIKTICDEENINICGSRTAVSTNNQRTREGNDAFFKDREQVINSSQSLELIEYAIKHQCPPDFYNKIYDKFSCTNHIDCVHLCIAYGRRDLTITTMEKIKQISRYGFHALYHQVLKFNDEALTVKNAHDTVKKTKDAYQMTLIHCAAINPNPKYLKQLLTISSAFDIVDKQNRRPIHYAAACEGTGPLEYLLSKDVKFNVVDKKGNTPLNIAVMCGRISNVEVLLSKAKEKAELNDPENQLEHEKYGLASIDQMNTSHFYPLHLAVLHDHLQCVDVLLQYGAQIDTFTGTSTDKLTSLMIACQIGSLDIVKCLVKNGARVEARDRFQRTPLIHACIYGHAHIVSYLLRIGANSNSFDSSMNTPLHYAIAYGWYFCVQLLMAAGADVDCANYYQMSCLRIGLLKGHYIICDYLLHEHKANINLKIDDGLTILILTLKLTISKVVMEQLEYLVLKHNADCTVTDVNGRTAFHYLASNTCKRNTGILSDMIENDLQKYYCRIGEILLEHGCNPTQMDNKAQTPLMLALESDNVFIVDFLINRAKVKLTSDISGDGKTSLHYFAMNSENSKLVDILMKIPTIDELKQMAKVFDNEGRTPFHYCTKSYAENFKNRHDPKADRAKYHSIIRMIRFFLDTLNLDPDVPMKHITDHQRKTSELDIRSTFDTVNSNSTTAEKFLHETPILYLLYDTSYSDSMDEHPLQILLKKSKNINVPIFETGRTPLLQAIHAQHFKTVSLLLQNPSCDVNLAAGKDIAELGKTPLILACKFHYLSVIRELLNHPKCDLLARDNHQNQALHYFLATSTRSDEYLQIFQIFIEKLLILGKHTLNSTGELGHTPLHVAIQYNIGTAATTYTVEEVLIENGSDLLIKDDSGNLPLHHVFLGNRSTNDPSELCTCIMQAMEYKSLDTVNKEGQTPLHLAVVKGSTFCIMLLLNHKANCLIEDKLSNSPIATTIAMNSLNLFIIFLQQPINIDLSQCYHRSYVNISNTPTQQFKSLTESFSPNIKTKVIEEDSLISLIIKDRKWQRVFSIILDDLPRFHLTYFRVLEAMISNKNLDFALHLLATIKNRTSLNERNVRGQNLYHIVALSQISNDVFMNKCLTYLYQSNVDWNVPDDYGMYPLHYACIFHNKIFIHFLQNKYPDTINFQQTDQYGNTAYGLLFWNLMKENSIDETFLRSVTKSHQALNCLCTYENRIPRNPLSLYSLKSSKTLVVPETPVEMEDFSTIIRTTPLINAVIYDKFEIVKTLLEFGVDVNQPDEEKLTPLMHAVRQNNIDVVRLLLNHGKQLRDENKMNESFSFKDKININMNAADALGRTCIHHLIQPFFESYNIAYANNIELLELLHSAGASLVELDLMKFTPLQYATKHHGCRHLYNKLRDLISQHPMEVDESSPPCFVVNDPNENLRGLPDYYSDAEQHINEYIMANRMEDDTSVDKVDPLSKMNETGYIVIDEQTKEPFDIRLTITDIDQGLLGLYNFYRMQLIKHRTKTDLYLLFTRWGRIGDDDGQHQLIPYSSFDECRAEFCKIFLEKTGNSWEDINRFQQQSKKYNLVQFKKNSQKYEITDVPIDFERLNNEVQHVPSKLQSEAYKSFFRMFLNSEAMRTNIAKTKFDATWASVSQLKTESLKRARDILTKLKIHIERKDNLKLKIQQTDTDDGVNNLQTESDDQMEFKLMLESICQLTNDYYSIIPLEGYGSEKLPIIDTVAAVKVQAQKLDDILELELSYKIVLAAQANLNRMSPLDYLYKSINCQFEALNQDDLDCQLILRYIWASSPGTKVDEIFKVKRENDDEQFMKRNLGNRYLLWHGTNVCNLMSILIRGLLVEPMCAKSTGRSFGTGIYTADTFAKSLSYCSGVDHNGYKYCFMLLCEVALGHCHDIIDRKNGGYSAPLDVNIYQSRKGHGSSIPDPRHTIVTDRGVCIPLGNIIKCNDPQHSSHSCTHNEYVVPDSSQIVIRYIIQFLR